MENKYQLQGMSCGGCVSNVKRALQEIPGVENADVQLNPQSVVLTTSVPIAMEALQTQLSKAGNYTLSDSVDNGSMDPASEVHKTGPGSNPENKFKEGKPTSAATLDSIITSPVENVRAHSGEGFTNKGTVPDYEEEK